MNLRFRPEFEEEWTHAAVRGEAETSACNILISRLLQLDYEVEVDWEGEWTDPREVDFDGQT